MVSRPVDRCAAFAMPVGYQRAQLLIPSQHCASHGDGGRLVGPRRELASYLRL